MKSHKLSDLSRTEVDSLKARLRIDFSSIFNVVQPIVDDIRSRSDAAVKDEIYGKVVVASKVPLPNYRPDLDDKRPQREAVIPLSLQGRVEGLLQELLDRTTVNSEKAGDNLDKMEANNQLENVDAPEHTDSYLDGSVMEKVLQRRSLRVRNMQSLAGIT